MEAEEVLKLYDTYWFELEFFKNNPPFLNLNKNPPLKVHEELEKSKNYFMPTFQIRSLSDRGLGGIDQISFSSDSPSPNMDTLFKPKLRKILSGKEITEISCSNSKVEMIENSTKKNKLSTRRISSSKSLSELEFEELKGFTDLGFVFSEEDKDSDLVSIIPGLNRLGRKGDDQEEANIDEHVVVSRPYLSEAWADLDKKMVHRKLIRWKNEALSNKNNNMKEHLKVWAQTVASTVKY